MTAYVIDPLDKFPKRWKDPRGPIRVMGELTEGFVMVRRPGAMPFVLRVSDLLGATKNQQHGPFEVVGRKVVNGEAKP